MNEYAILNTSHPDYNYLLSEQIVAFENIPENSNFRPGISLDGTKALIKLFIEPTNSDCIISIGGEEIPPSRNMEEWEIPGNPPN